VWNKEEVSIEKGLERVAEFVFQFHGEQDWEPTIRLISDYLAAFMGTRQKEVYQDLMDRMAKRSQAVTEGTDPVLQSASGPEKRTLGDLPLIRNFAQVVRRRRIDAMKPELYRFLVIHCGFTHLTDIEGFKAVFRKRHVFEGVFIRHFDASNRFYFRVPTSDHRPYHETGFTKADIKREFERIVGLHKSFVEAWARESNRKERFALFLSLKNEFEPEEEPS
jgi:hypothetical protein